MNEQSKAQTIDRLIFKLTKTQTAFNGPKTAL